MNRGEIRDEARILIAEVSKSAGFADDTDLNTFINQAITDICIVGLVYEKSETINVTQNTSAYSVASDWIQTRNVLDQNDVALTPVHPTDIGRYYQPSGSTTYPYYWYNWGSYIYLKPTYTGTSSINYTHQYYALDTALTSDSSSPNLPSKYHRLLSVFCAYRYFMKVRAFNEAMMFLQDYTRALNTALDRYIARFPAPLRVTGVLKEATPFAPVAGGKSEQ